jgi:hemoglobin
MNENVANTPYELIGGAPAILSLVDRFYFYMDILPEAGAVRKMHAPNLAGAKAKLFKFLSGWLGGPDLFVQEYGHPRLRQRHFPFEIGEQEADQWLLCMQKALAEIEMDSRLRENLWQALVNLAKHMVNR